MIAAAHTPGPSLSRREAVCVIGAGSVACVLGLAGCGATDEDRQAVCDSVDSELNQLTTLSASELLGDSLENVEKLGISGDDFLDAFFDGTSWSTGDVSFEGSGASVKVSLTCRALSSVLDALKDAYTAQTLEDGGHPGESDLYRTAGKALLDCVHAASLETREATVALSKQNGFWLVDDEGRSALISALIGS